MDTHTPSAPLQVPAPPGAVRRARTSGIDRALQILDHLRGTGRAATAYDIARSIGAPVSTVYAIVDDLLDKRLLSHNGGNMVWLGPRLFQYGLAYSRSLDLHGIAIEEMHGLARAIGETVQVCQRDDDRMVVIAMAEGSGHFRVTSRIGTRVPLNWTASGRLLAGHLPRDERVALFRHSVASPTGRAETDPETLADAAATALEGRLCIQIGQSDFSLACIAAPIRDAAGACAATISIVTAEDRVAQNHGRFTRSVQDAAQRIEERLGHGTPA